MHLLIAGGKIYFFSGNSIRLKYACSSFQLFCISTIFYSIWVHVRQFYYSCHCFKFGNTSCFQLTSAVHGINQFAPNPLFLLKEEEFLDTFHIHTKVNGENKQKNKLLPIHPKRSRRPSDIVFCFFV